MDYIIIFTFYIGTLTAAEMAVDYVNNASVLGNYSLELVSVDTLETGDTFDSMVMYNYCITIVVIILHAKVHVECNSVTHAYGQKPHLYILYELIYMHVCIYTYSC